MDTMTEANSQPHPLRVYRAARRMSQKQVASASGVARSTIIRVESGERPSLKTALAIASAVGVDRLALFGPDPEADHGS